MSRYVDVELGAWTRAEWLAACARLGLAVQQAPAGEAVLLPGSLECADEPVAIRIDPASVAHLGLVEGVGVDLREGVWRLVCGDVDRRILEEKLVPKLQRTVAELRVESLAAADGLTIQRTVDADGSIRLHLGDESS